MSRHQTKRQANGRSLPPTLRDLAAHRSNGRVGVGWVWGGRAGRSGACPRAPLRGGGVAIVGRRRCGGPASRAEAGATPRHLLARPTAPPRRPLALAIVGGRVGVLRDATEAGAVAAPPPLLHGPAPLPIPGPGEAIVEVCGNVRRGRGAAPHARRPAALRLRPRARPSARRPAQPMPDVRCGSTRHRPGLAPTVLDIMNGQGSACVRLGNPSALPIGPSVRPGPNL